MTLTSDIDAALNVVQSHAMAAALFERVNGHEPKNSPGSGVTCAIWVDAIAPLAASGLNSTSVRVAFKVRIYTSMTQEPQDGIDPQVIAAVDYLMGAYTGDFDLGVANVRCIDLLGMAGVPLSAQAGYLTQQQTMYRVMDITLPILFNDAWTQG